MLCRTLFESSRTFHDEICIGENEIDIGKKVEEIRQHLLLIYKYLKSCYCQV